MLWFATLAKGLVEFAGLLLLGRGLVFLLSFGRHESNPIYAMFRLLTLPLVRATRAIAPRFVLDTHIPALAFIVLFWLWLGLKFWQVLLLFEAGAV